MSLLRQRDRNYNVLPESRDEVRRREAGALSLVNQMREEQEEQAIRLAAKIDETPDGPERDRLRHWLAATRRNIESLQPQGDTP